VTYPADAARAVGVNTRGKPRGLELMGQAITECSAELASVRELLELRDERDHLPSVIAGIVERLDVAMALARQTEGSEHA
jgi:hypothetical protein